MIETRTSGFDEVDLNEAHRVIGVGRGLKAQEDLALIETLADAIGAEVACSRPVAEGLNWMGKDRYIGSSGAHIAPQLYSPSASPASSSTWSACSAETIVAINSTRTPRSSPRPTTASSATSTDSCQRSPPR